jgi:MerR family transcriptional regulator, redox-sensitive transcriptional activator SoxR
VIPVPDLPISAVARQVGLRPSAIRYYERIGLLPAPLRSRGRRRYDVGAIRRLLVIGRARAAGFSLTEIRRLFTGFPDDAAPAERWRALSPGPLGRVRTMMARLEAMERLLRDSCRCRSLEECGERLLALECAPAASATVAPRAAADLLNLRRGRRAR